MIVPKLLITPLPLAGRDRGENPKQIQRAKLRGQNLYILVIWISIFDIV